MPQLAHAGVDDGIAGAAVLPGGQQAAVAGPGEGVEIGAEVALRQVGEMNQQVIREFAPADLGKEFVDVAATAFGRWPPWGPWPLTPSSTWES